MLNLIKIGSLIRSYDFNCDKTCYMIGEVVEITEEYYVCDLKRVVFEGVDKEVKKSTFRTVKQGLLYGDRKNDPRIEFLL